MLHFKNISLLILILTVLSGLVAAQPPASLAATSSAKDSQEQGDFVSVDGNFTIALPQNINGFMAYKPNAKTKGGSQFQWRTPTDTFTISYIDHVSLPETAKKEIQLVIDDSIAFITKIGGQVISTKEISLNGNWGREVIVHLKEPAIVITRYYLVQNRSYVLSAGRADKEDGATQIKILDSFKLIDGKAMIAQKLAAATLQHLPQEPAVKRMKSDVEDEGLRGRVKSVVEKQEDLAGNWYVTGLKMSVEDHYDENGNKTKRILYDYKGNPSSVIVFGFIEGMRVSKHADLTYEYNPPPIAIGSVATRPASIVKLADSRYNYQRKNKYDEKGHLKESVEYENTGEISDKIIFLYEGNKIEESSYDKEGKLTFQTTEILDDKSNVIEKTFVHQNENYPDSKYTFAYDSFDEKGNWTKRTVTGKEGQTGGTYKEQRYIEYRTISYYQ